MTGAAKTFTRARDLTDRTVLKVTESVAGKLLSDFPEIAAQLDSDRNDMATADQIAAGSAQKHWWRCSKGPDHSWQATVISRTRAGAGCPFCSGQRVSVTNSLSTRFPEITRQLDRDCNGGVTADQIVAGSESKYWWRCSKGSDHAWEASAAERTRGGTGCPFCVGKKPSVTNSLSARFPEIARQLDPERNDDVTADQIVAGSEKKFWWRCGKGSDHVWQATVSARTSSGTGCPCCTGRRVSVTNSLAALFPEIAAQLDPERNGGITAEQIVAGSNTKYWWRCGKGPDHVWKATVASRSRNGNGCPGCSGRQASVTNSLAALFPGIAAQLDPERNGGITADQIVAGSGQKYWWRCPNDTDHVWQATVSARTSSGTGCPCCTGRRVSVTNSLAALFPGIAAQLDPERNGGITADQIVAGSGQRYWWRCPNGTDHVWQATASERTGGGTGCPYCRGLQVSATNSLAALFPEIAAQLDPERNGAITADQIVTGSNKKYWWRCNKGPDHSWNTSANKRTGEGTGCPFCASQKVSMTNSLAALFPEIAAQLDPERNGAITADQIVAGSGQKYWWRCPKGTDHVWQSAVNHRTNGGNGCPRCNTGWTVGGLREFLRGLRAHLGALPPADLYSICRTNGLLRSNKAEFAWRLLTGEVSEEELDALIDGLANAPSLSALAGTDAAGFEEHDAAEDSTPGSLGGTTTEKFGAEEIAEVVTPDGDTADDEPPLPVVSIEKILASAAAIAYADADDETVDYLVASAVGRIWTHAYLDATDALAKTERERDDPYAERVRLTFRTQHAEAKTLQIPAGYAFRPAGPGTDVVQPNLMQRRVAAQVRTERRVGNWSGTGAGKTLSAVLASRVIDAELTVICGPNSTVGLAPDGRPDGSGWIGAIRNAFPDVEVAWKTWAPQWKTTNRPRYLVMNYEQFQAPDAEARIARFLAAEHPGMIVIDEIHRAKQRNAEQMSLTKRLVGGLATNAAKARPDLAVLGMSATPVINNLQEGRSLVELITGEVQDDLNTKVTLDNCLALYQRLVRLGSRWMPQWEPTFVERRIPIDCGAVLDDIRRATQGQRFAPLPIEQILTRVRIPAIVAAIEPGEAALVYTHYVDGIVDPLMEALREAGHRVSAFTGDRREGLDDFRAGRTDVLVASSAIATGVDGLQDRCSKLIVNCLPWTAADYEQLKGRLMRHGQHAEIVEVILPVTFADNDGERWSWCESRLARNHWKASVADAAVDGVIPKGVIESESALVARSLVALDEWLARIEAGETSTISRRLLDIPLAAGLGQARTARYGDFSVMNARWNHTGSGNLHKRLLEDPTEWEQYHRLYRERRSQWAVVPATVIAQRLLKRPAGTVADLGCGEMLLADGLNGHHKVLGFDHVAIDNRVMACDISAIPLDNEAVDTAVLCLALMGANCTDYLREAHRILRLDGQLWVAEAISRIGDVAVFTASVERLGFDLVGHPEHTGQFLFMRFQRAERDPVPDAQLAWRNEALTSPSL